MTKKKLYLDVCALCRPYDDQSQLRVKLETDSVLLVLDHIRLNKFEMIISDVHLKEIESINDAEEKTHLSVLISQLGTLHRFENEKMKTYTEFLISEYNIGVADAAHLTIAEFTSDYFISCDDKLLVKAKKMDLQIICANPIEFIIKENLK